ncbi:hypothetical protein [Streptomyces sp. NPDC088348]|uniref:SbtR family transcriptional regulator n=1 Tax=Streptomyces sp. NPDC088348 TaxID=3365853 RepID=UPI0038013E63
MHAHGVLGLHDAGDEGRGPQGDPYGHSRDMIGAAITTLMETGTAAGALRSDIRPSDLVAALAGIALTSAKPERRDQAERLLDLLLDGLKPAPPQLPES